MGYAGGWGFSLSSYGETEELSDHTLCGRHTYVFWLDSRILLDNGKRRTGLLRC